MVIKTTDRQLLSNQIGEAMKKPSNNFLILNLAILGLALGACSSPLQTTTQQTPALSPTIEAAPPTTSAGQKGLELTDGLGRQINLNQPAQRVVSLAPSNTEILFAVSAGSQVVGRDTFSDYPPESQDAADIGGGFGDLNTETIVSLDPDLVLASSLTPQEQITALEDLGLIVFVLSNPSGFEGLYENLEVVSQLTGHSGEAAALIDTLRARVSAVDQKISAVSERPLVFYELDGSEPDAPWTAGPRTFVSTLITMAGGENLGDQLEGEWIQVSAEELIARNPDVILLGDYTWGGVTPEDVAARSGWEAIAAVKNDNVHTFDDNLVSRPGPRLVLGLELMAQLLHPELFE
jgi:iron complex transport system substrate-binding protein